MSRTFRTICVYKNDDSMMVPASSVLLLEACRVLHVSNKCARYARGHLRSFTIHLHGTRLFEV